MEQTDDRSETNRGCILVRDRVPHHRIAGGPDAAPRSDDVPSGGVPATAVADQVALLLVQAAMDHEREGRQVLAERFRQRAAELLMPRPTP